MNNAINPSHYNDDLNVIQELMMKRYNKDLDKWDVANSMKYLFRALYKHDTPIEDLNKAIRYIELMKERYEQLDSSEKHSEHYYDIDRNRSITNFAS